MGWSHQRQVLESDTGTPKPVSPCDISQQAQNLSQFLPRTEELLQYNFFFLWKVTQLTKLFLCLASERKGDFSHRHLCKLTLTPKSKAGIFLALVSLTATKTQLLKLCWRAMKNFGLRRPVPLYILCQESVPGQLQREKGFSKEEFRLCETSWLSPWATWFSGMCPSPRQGQQLGLDDP